MPFETAELSSKEAGHIRKNSIRVLFVGKSKGLDVLRAVEQAVTVDKSGKTLDIKLRIVCNLPVDHVADAVVDNAGIHPVLAGQGIIPDIFGGQGRGPVLILHRNRHE